MVASVRPSMWMRRAAASVAVVVLIGGCSAAHHAAAGPPPCSEDGWHVIDANTPVRLSLADAKRKAAAWLKVPITRPVTARLLQESAGNGTGREDEWQLTYFVNGIPIPAMDNGLKPRAVVVYFVTTNTKPLPSMQTYC